MKDKKLKVLFLPKWYPNRFDVLDGIFIVDHAKAAALHHDVFLLFVHADPALSSREKIIFNNGNGFSEMTVYFKTQKTGIKFLDKINAGFLYLKVQFKFYRRIKKIWGSPDITHVHVLLRSSFLALWLKLSKGIPFIITEHWTGYNQGTELPGTGTTISGLKKVILGCVMKKSAVVTTVSQLLQDSMKNISNKAKFEILSNATDENLFQIRKRKYPSIRKKFIHISTLNDHQKQFSAILRTLARVSELRSDFELHVIGGGIEKEKQMDLAQELQLLNRIVYFHGVLPKEKVAKMIRESDAMILFSFYENQPCVLLESFLCGVPVIAPDIAGVNEIVNKKNGILVSIVHTGRLYKAILSFLSDDVKFDSREIRSDALIYGYRAIAENMSKLYYRVKNGRLNSA